MCVQGNCPKLVLSSQQQDRRAEVYVPMETFAQCLKAEKKANKIGGIIREVTQNITENIFLFTV